MRILFVLDEMRNYNRVRKLRGRSAIEMAHAGISGDDERRLDNTIRSLYSVESDEALEIHTNYHVDRIFSSLVRRAVGNGMKRETVAEKLKNLDFIGVARQVAAGKLAEAAAVEALFRELSRSEFRGNSDDRYINFYG
ncbi:MAG: hypothetical protein MN733_41525 [Nitrososphaera sp.]|nr:hypothetical protein [Nitrososphaera sp.]